MNVELQASKNLQRVYVRCLESKIKEWMAPKEPDHESKPSTQEFCTSEKFAWMDHMRQHLPVQYDNI